MPSIWSKPRPSIPLVGRKAVKKDVKKAVKAIADKRSKSKKPDKPDPKCPPPNCPPANPPA